MVGKPRIDLASHEFFGIYAHGLTCAGALAPLAGNIAAAHARFAVSKNGCAEIDPTWVRADILRQKLS